MGARVERAARSVAIVGGGVAGLTAAYILSSRDRVTLFEADTRVGGHAHTHFLDRGDGQIVGVDSAFLVHNDRTYPTLCRLFADLGITTRETEMSMSVRADDIELEYAGARGIGGLFASWSSLARPRYLAMLAEVKRFHQVASRVLASADRDDHETLGSFLDRHRFSDYFIEHFVTPLVAAVWSCAPGEAVHYPARYLFVFLEHHGMLSVFGSPTWRTVQGGSVTYVEAILGHLAEVRTGAAISSVRRTAGGVLVTARGQSPRAFDAVVIATHSDQALQMLDPPTATERVVLGAISYTTNRAQLHTDDSILPRHRRARASWNYLLTPDRSQVVVTYDVTRLMRLDGPRRFLVTLGGRELVDPACVLAEMTYRHPLCTPESVAAQRLLLTIGDDRVVFAGAYYGWGFHEDGAASGLRAAQRLGGEWPSAARGRQAVSGAPALYRTRITHRRRAPVRHEFAHHGYSWYVDVDALPRLPWWLRPLAGFYGRDHLYGAPTDSLRRRVDEYLAEHGVDLRGGQVTALLQARVFGYMFNPLTLFWCHDTDGTVRYVIAEVHNTYGGRHAYLVPANGESAAWLPKSFYVSPFHPVAGRYRIHAPRPQERLDVTVCLHVDNQPPFVAAMHGRRRPATAAELLRVQAAAPLAPLMGALGIRAHGIWLWLRRVPVVPRDVKVNQP